MLPAPPDCPLRRPTGPGRPYPDEVVARVGALLVGDGLSRREAAARTGLREDTVACWARRHGWSRANGAGHNPDDQAGAFRPDPRGRATSQRPYRYPPEIVEAARERVEGSREGLERIALDLGVARGTLARWRRRFGWQRPAAPARSWPAYYRSRRLGRPYGGDAVGRARDLVTGSRLPAGRIAAQAGISRATLYRWMKRPGWTRPPTLPARSRYRPAYGPGVMAAARELYATTGLPTRIIAARAETTPERVAHWARAGGWTRPR